MLNFKIKPKILFICNQNQNRSKTAEELFKPKFDTKSAGLYTEKPVSRFQLKWADLIVVMEKDQINTLNKRFPEECFKKRILNIGIPDIFNHNQPELIKLLKKRFDEINNLATL